MLNLKKITKITAIIIVSTIIIGYAYFQTRSLSNGPVIEINSPVNGATASKSLIKIQGNIRNATHITLNDRQIFVDEEGKLNETILLLEGYNIVEIEVTDKFERVKKEVLELIYLPINE